MTIEIYIATHLKINYKVPPIYKKIQVNAAVGNIWGGEYLNDCTGENISQKNPMYSELTALYHLWRNSTASIKGLVHYRRFLGSNDAFPPYVPKKVFQGKLSEHILDSQVIYNNLSSSDILLPQQCSPYPRTVKEDLLLYCYPPDIEALRNTLLRHDPNEAQLFDELLSSSHISYLNMLVTKRDIFDSYCDWVFPLLEEYESRIDATQYDKQHKRVIGYMSELLLNVFVTKNGLRPVYKSVVTPELSDQMLKSGLNILSNELLTHFYNYPIFQRVPVFKYINNKSKMYENYLLGSSEPTFIDNPSVSSLSAFAENYLNEIGYYKIENCPLGSDFRLVSGRQYNGLTMGIITSNNRLNNDSLQSLMKELQDRLNGRPYSVTRFLTYYPINPKFISKLEELGISSYHLGY